MSPLLPFQRQALTDLIAEDALCIMAKGLGIRRVLVELLRICATSKTLMLLLNTLSEEEQEIQEMLLTLSTGEETSCPTLHVINSAVNANTR